MQRRRCRSGPALDERLWRMQHLQEGHGPASLASGPGGEQAHQKYIGRGDSAHARLGRRRRPWRDGDRPRSRALGAPPQATVQGVLASLPGRSPDALVCPFLRLATGTASARRVGPRRRPPLRRASPRRSPVARAAGADVPSAGPRRAARAFARAAPPSAWGWAATRRRGRLVGRRAAGLATGLVVLAAAIVLIVLGGGLPFGAFAGPGGGGGATPPGSLVAAVSASPLVTASAAPTPSPRRRRPSRRARPRA